MLGSRVASSPSDVEDLCLWISALRLLSSAFPFVTVVAAYSKAGRGLFQKPPINDMGCDTVRVQLG